MTTTGTASTHVDSSTAEVIRNYLNSVTNEMQRTLVRTAYNPAIYEMIDFGISLYDADLNLISDSPGLSMFLGANDVGLRKGVEFVGEETLNEGDIVLLNYPYWSSAHTLDACLFAPVFHDGELIGYAVVRAHWLDMGQKDEGYVLDSTSVHQEGIIFPGTKIYKRGEPDEEKLDLLRFNVRGPHKVMGDLNAQIAAINVGKRRLNELFDKYGPDVIDSAVDMILDHGRAMAKDEVAKLKDGAWQATDYIDNDSISEDPVKIGVEVTIEGENFTVDFSASDPETEGPVNVQFGSAEAVGKIVLKALTTPREPSNAGHFAPLQVIAPEGNLFHATYPAATFIGWPSITAIDVVFEALAKGMPDRIPAGSGGDICPVALFGEDPDTGHLFLTGSNEGVGWGASAGQDGENALMHLSESAIQNTPVEVFEATSPVRFERYELRTDSGGPGEYRGGLGIRRDYRILDDINVFSPMKKTRTASYGFNSGQSGYRNSMVLEDLQEGWADRLSLFVDNSDLYASDEEGTKFTGMFRGSMVQGEQISNRTGGGGGWGHPYDRDPETVRNDVIDGYISKQAARDEYGVVIRDDGSIDSAETETIRSTTEPSQRERGTEGLEVSD